MHHKIIFSFIICNLFFFTHNFSQTPPAQITVDTLDGTDGFIIDGLNVNDWLGTSASSIGDVNNDGIDDIIMGSINANTKAGEVYIIFGSDSIFTMPYDLTSLDGTNGFIIEGESQDNRLGVSASFAGDINNDNIDDFIIGAHTASPNDSIDAGKSYIIFGSNSGYSSPFDLTTLDGTNGFVTHGINEGDKSGSSVSFAGDINADGIDDLIIGASNANETAGEAYVIYGQNSTFTTPFELSSLDGTEGFILEGNIAGDFAGGSVSNANDFNDDGIDDLIIGANAAAPFGTRVQAGIVYIFYGTSSGISSPVSLDALDGTNGLKIYGEGTNDRTGVSVSAAGDINGDFVQDVIIGAHLANPNGQADNGQTFIVYGGSGLSSPFDLNNINGSNGFSLNGINNGDRSGVSVDGIGDVNGDQLDDLIIGAYFGDPNSQNQSGETYIVYGSNTFASQFELNTLNGTNGYIINGVDLNDNSGFKARDAGDFNNDGLNDVIISARHADAQGNFDSGECYVVFGKNNQPANHEVRLGQPQFDCDQNTVRFDIEVQSTITGVLDMNFRAFLSDSQFSNPIVYLSDDITDVTVSVDNGPSAIRFDLSGSIILVNGTINNTIDSPNTWKKVGSLLASATTPLDDNFCSSVLLNSGLNTQDISTSELIILVNNEEDADNILGIEHYNWIDDPNSAMPDGSPDNACIDSACIPVNFDLRIVNPQFDCAQNTITYDIEFKSTIVGTANVILRLFFSDEYLNPYIYNADGVTLASNFSAQTAPLVDIFDLNGVGVTFTNCAVNEFISSPDVWIKIATIKSASSNPLDEDFCGSIIFHRDLDIEHIINANVQAVIIDSNVSYTDADGFLGLEHFNWTNDPNNNLPTGSPDGVCIDSGCENTSDPKVNYWSNDGDYYSDNPNYGFIFTSPNGKCWRLKVDDDGNPVFEPVICP